MPQFEANIKHNKKRNAGLLYEWLIGYITECVSINKDSKLADLASNIAIRYFNKNTELGKELDAIRFLSEKKGAFEIQEICNDPASIFINMQNMILATEAINEFKNKVKSIDLRQSYIEKSNLIKEVNLTLSNSLYSKDVDDYRLYASIYGLMESIKKENYREQANYEKLIHENLLKVSRGKEDSRPYSDEEFNNLTESIYNRIKHACEEQKELIENWNFYINGGVNDSTYSEFLNAKAERVKEIINEALNANSDSKILVEKLNKLKSTYDNLNDLDFIKATEHILEGFNIKRLF